MPNLVGEPVEATRARDREVKEEARGASQIGPFDYCPRLGFREYWYPGIWSRNVGAKKPVRLKMLGEELVLFRGGDGAVVALNDWCPHRGARLSNGVATSPARSRAPITATSSTTPAGASPG